MKPNFPMSLTLSGMMGLLVLLTACVESNAASLSVDPSAVTVFAADDLGDAAQISDFMGAGGGLGDTRDNDALAAAWRNLGFAYHSFEGLHEEHEHRLYDITRDAGGTVRVGFDRYDLFMTRILETLRSRPVVNLGDIPRALSSQPHLEDATGHMEAGSGGYSAFLPRDLREWEELVSTIVRHNVERFGLRGLTYGAPGEADFPTRFLRAPGDDPRTQLTNHIELYAATWRGVKSADPTARIGGPNTMSWRITPSTDTATFSLEEWIRALGDYNAAAGGSAIGLDYVAWQDYSWASDRISDGADAVSGFLAAAGFDPKTPKFLATSGWGSWSSDYGQTDYPLHRRASYIAHNIIREFNDPRARQFGLAVYYFFHTDDGWWQNDMENLQTFRRSALVAFDTQGRMELTPMYAAFQMAKAMREGGRIVTSTAPVPLEVMAVRDDRRVIITINNHTADAVSAPVSVRDLPFTPAWRTIRVIDESKSRDGNGLETGTTEGWTPAFSVVLRPYATIQIEVSR